MAVIIYTNAVQAEIAREVSGTLGLDEVRLVHLMMPTAPSVSEVCLQAERIGGTEFEDEVFESVMSAALAALLDGEDFSVVVAVVVHENDGGLSDDLEHFLVRMHGAKAEFVRVEQNSSTGAQWPTYCAS